MDIHKLNWTSLQNQIFRLLCVKAGEKINQRRMSKFLNVSPTAISKALKLLIKEEILSVNKNSDTKILSIELNRDKKEVINFKRVENLNMIYEVDLPKFLREKFPGSAIILFGSYSKGEDYFNSDIDIAVIGCTKKNIDLKKYEKSLGKEIILQFYDSFKEVQKNLRNNLLNGIVLEGSVNVNG